MNDQRRVIFSQRLKILKSKDVEEVFVEVVFVKEVSFEEISLFFLLKLG